jgi:glycosyltransferase involved in cell wall biosynthesis
LKVLLELRPALDGHAGIPQAARLLFQGIAKLDGFAAEGLIQSSNRVLASALTASAAKDWSQDRRINRMSRVVVSLHVNPKPSRFERWAAAAQLFIQTERMLLGALVGRPMALGYFEPEHFRDFLWRSMFAKTLPIEDFEAVTGARFRVARVPWSAMHAGALMTRRLGAAVYSRLCTEGFDVMIAETPYPGRVSAPTRLVVRYHDAIPVLMPHTISDKSFHQAAHFNALRRNVADGAWFACVSEATRRDLLSIFPQAEGRSVTIHNTVSHHYFDAPSSPLRVPEIINMRRSRGVKGGGGRSLPTHEPMPPYLLMVSTIEPRKNHLTLLSAWEQLRTELQPDLQLVLVGALGWDHKAIVRKLWPWFERGGLHLLEDVPAPELRLLYRHASVTVCPSFGEGFDFSGVEAMRCGGVVAASDIPVHREIFDDAADFFTPYSSARLAASLTTLLSPEAAPRRQHLLARGAAVAARYLPERILPQWEKFLLSLKPR